MGTNSETDDLGRFISVDVKSLFEEILGSNKSMWILKIPLTQLHELLRQVAKRCSEINDPRLNELMLRLDLYDVPKKERTNLIRRMIKEQEQKEWEQA